MDSNFLQKFKTIQNEIKDLANQKTAAEALFNQSKEDLAKLGYDTIEAAELKITELNTEIEEKQKVLTEALAVLENMVNEIKAAIN